MLIFNPGSIWLNKRDTIGNHIERKHQKDRLCKNATRRYANYVYSF